jgi:predicted PurR-regulated permease PerM
MLPAGAQPTWRSIADDIYQLVGRYVTGNLLISLIAGSTTAIVLLVLGVPFALALGLLVAILDLIPLAGATLAATVVTLVALSESGTVAIIVFAFFVVYQQIENHLLQPLIYGRTVRLSPLAILISVLIGAEVAGVVGALVAIPAGGTIQILLDHWRAHRRLSAGDDAEPDEPADEPDTPSDGRPDEPRDEPDEPRDEEPEEPRDEEPDEPRDEPDEPRDEPDEPRTPKGPRTRKRAALP